MKKIFYWFIRLFLWFVSGFGLFDLVLQISSGGSDYMHPYAPYSFGGIERKKFLELYKKERAGNSIISDNIKINFNGAALVYRYFLSPWEKDYNHNR